MNHLTAIDGVIEYCVSQGHYPLVMTRTANWKITMFYGKTYKTDYKCTCSVARPLPRVPSRFSSSEIPDKQGKAHREVDGRWPFEGVEDTLVGGLNMFGVRKLWWWGF